MRTPRRLVVVLCALVICASSFTACGGGGDGDVASKSDTTARRATAGSTSSTALDDGVTDTSAPGEDGATTSAETTAPTTATTAAPSGSPSTAPSPTTTAAPATTTPTSPPTTAAQAGERHALTIENFTFSPVVLNIEVGDEVQVTNKDSASHTWTADNGSWNSGSLGEGGTFTHRFTTAGSFGYHCAIHPSMKGTVTVG